MDSDLAKQAINLLANIEFVCMYFEIKYKYYTSGRTGPSLQLY